MKPGSFYLKGVHSDDIGALISERPIIETPNRKIELKEIPGVNGAIPFDDGSYSNTQMALKIFYITDDEEDLPLQRSRVAASFLFNRYVEFIPYFDSEKIYKVINTEYPRFKGNSTFRHFDVFEVTFSVKPFKYLIGSGTYELLGSSTILNPTPYEAEPLITIQGSGDCTLTINGIEYVVKNIVDEVILDSEIQHCYKTVNGLLVNENSKMYSIDFPVFFPGNNVITWTGAGVTAIKIKPKWRSLV